MYMNNEVNNDIHYTFYELPRTKKTEKHVIMCIADLLPSLISSSGDLSSEFSASFSSDSLTLPSCSSSSSLDTSMSSPHTQPKPSFVGFNSSPSPSVKA